MAKYISLDCIQEILRSRSDELRGVNGDIGGAVSGAVKLIDSLAINNNTVEVVRCQDCRHADVYGPNIICKLYYGAGHYDWFCADGDQREDDNTDVWGEDGW